MVDTFYRRKILPRPGKREKEYEGLHAVRVFSIDKLEDFDKFGDYESPENYLVRSAVAAEKCLDEAGYKPSAYRYFYDDGTSSFVTSNTHTVHKRVLARFPVYNQIKTALAKTGLSPEYLSDSLLCSCWRAFSLLQAGKFYEALEHCMRVVDAHHRLAFTSFERDLNKARGQEGAASNGGKERAAQYPSYEEIQEWIDNKCEESPQLLYSRVCQLAEAHFSAGGKRCQNWKTIRKNTVNPKK
ncbi:hypothetical protein [Gilvimarinus algae]|uniref:Uncharacterized protein n=1 Tax=Gilvimarinus algae TaxID=3058037 RepID=A0ABT8TH94_9GAMM|nr:hypothetical protein [Gilvimarinus sp. SDUM040014]MDO3383433.1 hypothetical protein [Gilvimarinus sp. SDUM040014]